MTNAQARRPSRCPPSAFRMQQNVPPLPKDDAVLDLKVFVESEATTWNTTSTLLAVTDDVQFQFVQVG